MSPAESQVTPYQSQTAFVKSQRVSRGPPSVRGSREPFSKYIASACSSGVGFPEENKAQGVHRDSGRVSESTSLESYMELRHEEPQACI